jgi:quercetin dioxygenase-like cupin family protein
MDIREQLDQAGIEVIHHWATGLYSKEMRIPAGAMVGKHVHDYDHFSFLFSGSVSVTVDGESSIYNAPKLLVIEAGKEHVIRALTDVVWHCTHATTETDPEKVDAALKGEA